jgi:hypothetical protein
MPDVYVSNIALVAELIEEAKVVPIDGVSETPQ